MKKIFILFALLTTSLLSTAQTQKADGNTLPECIESVALFGRKLPQEKVYLHLDNNCYFLGDTIWFKSYVTRSDNDKASDISKILYVELLTPDGYVTERQQIPIDTKGNGYGAFVLNDSLYGGYYELRAYTRWQLNFGAYEHTHSPYAHRLFYNRSMEKDFFRDYDKLYSRVFPVYDKPQKEGQFVKNMTTRPLRRYFKNDHQKPDLKIMFYPEGGNLVAGTTCRIAFEAQNEKGEHITVEGTVKDNAGNAVSSFSTSFRGKGTCNLTCGNDTGHVYTANVNYQGKDYSFPLPQIIASGCALMLDATGTESVTAKVTEQGLSPASTDSMYVSIMRSGKMNFCQKIAFDGQHEATVTVPLKTLHTGVNDFTLFDAKGEVFADRLFFVNHHEYERAELTVKSDKEEYKPYEPVTLQLQMADPSQQGELSVAVRDNAGSENSYDNSDIRTEMLLGSELKGFIEYPAYYFEKDDAEHRTNLDLLLMVQGWRRFQWREMANLKNYQIVQLPEKALTLEGCVNENISYEDERRADTSDSDPWAEHDISVREQQSMKQERIGEDSWNSQTYKVANDPRFTDYVPTDASSYNTDLNTMAKRRSSLKKDVYVEASFVTADGKTFENEQKTINGQFSMLMPQIFGKCIIFLSAIDEKKKQQEDLKTQQAAIQGNDSTKQTQNTASNKHKKIKAHKEKGEKFMDEESYADFYVKRNLFYPRFPKMYSFYQENEPAYSDKQYAADKKGKDKNHKLTGTHALDEVVVTARRGGLRRVDLKKPTYVADAYQLFNDAADYGLNTGRFNFYTFPDEITYSLCADMGNEHGNYIQQRIDGITINSQSDSPRTGDGMHPTMDIMQKHFTDYEKDTEWRLDRLDKVYFYTDYEPRHEGSWQYVGSDKPEVVVDLHKLPNMLERPVYRDRYYILTIYSACTDFYSPDYSHTALPPKNDYRRTLYWNPVVRTDANGSATLHFYNNARCRQMNVSAEGLTDNGLPVITRHQQ